MTAVTTAEETARRLGVLREAQASAQIATEITSAAANGSNPARLSREDPAREAHGSTWMAGRITVRMEGGKIRDNTVMIGWIRGWRMRIAIWRCSG